MHTAAVAVFVEDPVLVRLFRDARACELYANFDEACAVIERHASVLGRSWMIYRVERAILLERSVDADTDHTPRQQST